MSIANLYINGILTQSQINTTSQFQTPKVVYKNNDKVYTSHIDNDGLHFTNNTTSNKFISLGHDDTLNNCSLKTILNNITAGQVGLDTTLQGGNTTSRNIITSGSVQANDFIINNNGISTSVQNLEDRVSAIEDNSLLANTITVNEIIATTIIQNSEKGDIQTQLNSQNGRIATLESLSNIDDTQSTQIETLQNKVQSLENYIALLKPFINDLINSLNINSNDYTDLIQ